MRPSERIEYSAITDRAPLRLPRGARVIVWPIVNVEQWRIDDPMPRTILPPPGGGRHTPDLPNWAWHEYGMRVGFWRLKAVLDSLRIRATLSINSSVCNSYPRLAAAARDADWEFMGHGVVQRPMHLVQDEPAAIRETMDALTRFTGCKPRGWLGPGLTETFDTVDHLAEAGFDYVADWVLDDQPCIIRTRSGRTMVALPYTVELNDITLMVVQNQRAVELYERGMAQFDQLYEEGSTSARIMAIAVHPYISGVPHRIDYFKRLMRELAEKPGVLFWTGDQILDWYRAAAPQMERTAAIERSKP